VIHFSHAICKKKSTLRFLCSFISYFSVLLPSKSEDKHAGIESMTSMTAGSADVKLHTIFRQWQICRTGVPTFILGTPNSS
jgi:hypothetical protein